MTKINFGQVESREIKGPLAYFVSTTFLLNSKRRFLKQIKPGQSCNIQNNVTWNRHGVAHAQRNKTEGFCSSCARSCATPILVRQSTSLTDYKIQTCRAERSPQTKQNFVNGNTNPKADLFIRQFSGLAKTKFLHDKIPVTQNKSLLSRCQFQRNGVNRKVIPKKKQTFLHQSSKKASFFILQKGVTRTGVRITGNKKVLQNQRLNKTEGMMMHLQNRFIIGDTRARSYAYLAKTSFLHSFGFATPICFTVPILFRPDSIFNQVLLASNHFYRLDSNRKLGYLYPTNLDKMSFLSSDLADLPLSLNTYTVLKQKGIHKIGSLVAHSENDLLQLLNRNRKMFAEIKRSSFLTAICGNA